MSSTHGDERTPEEIRRDIEATRANLGSHLEDLEYRADPTRIREEQVEKVRQGVRNRFTRARESVMGSSDYDDYGDRGHSTTDQARDRAHDAGQRLSGAPDAAKRQAQGNPVAAGLIAFGGGLLLASLLPASEPEQQAARQLRDRYEEPVREELRAAGQQAREELQPRVQEVAAELKSTAQEGVQHTREDAKSSARDLRDEARERAEDTRGG